MQQECQGLRTEKKELKTICESLHTEKEQLLGKIGELELHKSTLEESERQSQGQSGKMINGTTVVYGTDKDPRFTIRARAALIHASEDNVDWIMTDLE